MNDITMLDDVGVGWNARSWKQQPWWKRYLTYKVIFWYFMTNVVFSTIGVVSLFVLFDELNMPIEIGYVVQAIAVFLMLCNVSLALIFQFAGIRGALEVNIDWKMMKLNGGKK